MKVAIITANKRNANRVYTVELRQELADRYELLPEIVSKKNIEQHIDFLKETEYLFATWGMEHFTEDEIKKYFPSLKCVFYSAGTVQQFANEFLSLGIRVFSAWRANAIPVAEFTYAEIILATKGFYRAAKNSRFLFYPSANYSDKCGGNYRAKIGIIGVGSIGEMVARKLMDNDVDVFYYDPFLSEEKAIKLNIKSSSLEEIFKTCDVITNHLANKDELTNIFSGELFSMMKPYATFINTGRGRQVDEKGLAKAMRKVKTRTALLDVTMHEPINPFGRLARRRNIIITPHIAGSNGREVERMARYMIDEAMRVDENKNAEHEVSMDMLSRMA